MIKQGLKNFFKSLQYFFTPLGVLALGTIIGLSIGIPIIVDATNKMIEGVKLSLSTEVTINWNGAAQRFVDLLKELPWNDDAETALRTLFTKDWLLGTLSAVATVLFADVENIVDRVIAAITAYASQVFTSVLIVVLFTIVGIFLGYYLMRFQIHRGIARGKLWKSILCAIVNTIFNAVLFAFFIVCYLAWRPSAYITLPVIILLTNMVDLLEAFLKQGKKSVTLKEVFNVKNVVLLYVVDIIILIISFVFVYLMVLVTNQVVGVVLSIVLMEVTICVLDFNAEGYVKNLVTAKRNEKIVAAGIDEVKSGGALKRVGKLAKKVKSKALAKKKAATDVVATQSAARIRDIEALPESKPEAIVYAAPESKPEALVEDTPESTIENFDEVKAEDVFAEPAVANNAEEE